MRKKWKLHIPHQQVSLDNMSDIEHIKIPVRLSDGDGNNNAIIDMRRKMFSDYPPVISIEWWVGDECEQCCYYEDLTEGQRSIVNAAIYEYDRNLVRKTVE